MSMASPNMIRTRPPSLPVAVHLALGTGTLLCDIIVMSPLALGPRLDIILGWDWISSHDLRFLYPQGAVRESGFFDALAAPLQTTGSALVQTLIGRGEFRPCSAGWSLPTPLPRRPLPQPLRCRYSHLTAACLSRWSHWVPPR